MISLLNSNSSSSQRGNNESQEDHYHHDIHTNPLSPASSFAHQTQQQQQQPKYERHTFPQTSSPNDITQNWLNDQLARTLDNLMFVEMKLDSLTNSNSTNAGNGVVGGDNGQASMQESTGDVDADVNANSGIIESPENLLKSVEYLSLANAYLTISDNDATRMNNGDDNDSSAVQNEKSPEEEVIYYLSKQEQIQNQFLNILLHHPTPKQIASSGNQHQHQHQHRYTALHHGIYTRYVQYYTHLRSRCILELRKYIQQSNYPMITMVAAATTTTTTTTNDEDENNDIQDSSSSSPRSLLSSDIVTCVIKTLIQINLWYTSIMNHINNNGQSIGTLIQNNHQVEFILKPIITEFMKPIVQRVQYHFLPHYNYKNNDNSSNNSNQSNNAAAVGTNNNEQQQIIMDEIQKRPDKLLSWLTTYIKDTIVHESNIVPTVWENIQSIIVDVFTANDEHNLPCIHECFIMEMNTCIQYVLHQHKYIHHLKSMASQKTRHGNDMGNSTVLGTVIENVMKYDTAMIQIIHDSFDNDNNHHQSAFDGNSSTCNNMKTLMESIIVDDTELCQWWLECERINSLNALRKQKQLQHQQQHHKSTTGIKTTTNTILLPTTETFLSLLSTYENKIALMTKYEHKKAFMQKVEVPVCVAYMESMHEKASLLKRQLVISASSSSLLKNSKNVPTPDDVRVNIQNWIGIITGTKVVAQVLSQRRHSSSSSSSSSNTATSTTTTTAGRSDLNLERERIGSSLNRLADAMVDELSSTFVEDLLLERTKLASYLMQCAYTMTSSQIDECHNFHLKCISSELVEVHQYIGVLCDVCIERRKLLNPLMIGDDEAVVNKTDDEVMTMDQPQKENHHDTTPSRKTISSRAYILHRIPNDIMKNIAKRIEEKFLEVALDYNDMIPELNCVGSQIFCFDTNAIAFLFVKEHQVYFSRLKELTTLISMEDVKFVRLRSALRDLLVDPLDALVDEDHDKQVISSSVVERLERDGTLFNEVQSMILAQGFNTLTIYDTINIMNRRKVISTESEDIMDSLR